eukprot:m.68102 g.68102  ORF g.68102 m.68102 type:complete len:259 (+) comp35490_c0_seq1:1947-2723(+)
MILNSSQYMESANGSILRCNTFGSDFNTTDIVKIWNYNSIAITLSTVSSVFSIVACFMLLSTYFLFGKLRNFPGLCMMSYAFALGVYYTLIIFGAGQVGNESVCTAMGFLLHYFALSHFTWSTVLALNLVDSFIAKRLQNPSSGLGKSLGMKFLLVSLFAWGVPLVICSICLALIYLTDLDIYYASEKICWLQDKYAVLYAIGIPVAIIMLVNLGSFIGLAVVLTSDMKATQFMSKKSNLSKIKKKIRVFLGLFACLD